MIMIQAAATGKSAKSVREFLEKQYTESSVSTREGAILLAIRALLEVRVPVACSVCVLCVL